MQDSNLKMDFLIMDWLVIFNLYFRLATEKILSNETLVRVPVKLLFNTKDAFLSELEPMFR